MCHTKPDKNNNEPRLMYISQNRLIAYAGPYTFSRFFSGAI